MSSRWAIACLLPAALAAAACDRQNPAPEQANADTPAPDEAAPATAPAQKVDRSHRGEAAPAAAFTDAAGKAATLAAFRGRPLLVNLWATWCAPCVKEMPTLDAAAQAAGERLRVIAVSQDMAPAKAKAFFAERKFARLTPYYDPELKLSLAYGANLPTTVLYGADGRERWRVSGDMDWTGAEAKALLAEAG